jgi:hypothetical protein
MQKENGERAKRKIEIKQKQKQPKIYIIESAEKNLFHL